MTGCDRRRQVWQAGGQVGRRAGRQLERQSMKSAMGEGRPEKTSVVSELRFVPLQETYHCRR